MEKKISAAIVYGSARMGPIFGGMIKSGQRAAAIIKEALGQ